MSFMVPALLAWIFAANVDTTFAQARHVVEVTRTDFTKEAKILSTDLTVFGISLGDSLA
jgi:hypothetical protein